MKRDSFSWQRVQQDSLGRGALERLTALAAHKQRVGEWSLRDSEEHYTKGSPIAQRARLRHALRARIGRSLPRLREFDNLMWLREAGFLAPRPLAALGTWQGGRPLWQGLVTARLPSGIPADLALGAATQSQRQAICLGLGNELARLHTMGFIHRDLYLRNILIVQAAAPRIGLLDCWRGGPSRAQSLAGRLLGRGAAYDMGCLFVHLPGLITIQEEEVLLQEYCRGRNLLPGDAEQFMSRIQTSRQVSARREIARRRKDSSPIQENWKP